MTRTARIFASVLVASILICALPSSCKATDLKEGVEQLARDLGNSVPEGRSLTIAVSDFPDLQGTVSDLGRYVAERLVTRLSARPEKFRVIERRRLDQVLGELRLGLSDLVDPAKAKQLGQMLGAQGIVVGTLSDLGNTVDIDARIIEIGTNSTFPGVSVTLTKDDPVRNLLERGRQAPQYPMARGANNGGGYSGSSASDGFAELPELRVEVESIQVMKDSSVLTSLKFINRGQSDFALIIDCCTGGWRRMYDGGSDVFHSFLTDDEGNQYRLAEYSGIGGFFKGSPLVLSPGIPKSVALRFSTSDSDRRGKVFSFISVFAMIAIDNEGRPQRDRNDYYIPTKTLNVSIRDLRPVK
jgi:TolB-like protein